MKNLEDLTAKLEEHRNPAAEIGRFLLTHSTDAGYLLAHLRNIVEALEADVKEETEFRNQMLDELN